MRTFKWNMSTAFYATAASARREHRAFVFSVFPSVDQVLSYILKTLSRLRFLSKVESQDLLMVASWYFIWDCISMGQKKKMCVEYFSIGFLMEKYLKHVFFCPELSPFLEVCPFEKIQTKSDACHIVWTVYARVLKFHIWIPHGKVADLYFFLVQVISLSGVMRLWKNENEILSARYLEKYLS